MSESESEFEQAAIRGFLKILKRLKTKEKANELFEKAKQYYWRPINNLCITVEHDDTEIDLTGRDNLYLTVVKPCTDINITIGREVFNRLYEIDDRFYEHVKIPIYIRCLLNKEEHREFKIIFRILGCDPHDICKEFSTGLHSKFKESSFTTMWFVVRKDKYLRLDRHKYGDSKYLYTVPNTDPVIYLYDKQLENAY